MVTSLSLYPLLFDRFFRLIAFVEGHWLESSREAIKALGTENPSTFSTVRLTLPAS